MANVVYPQVDFLHNPTNHPSSRFGFGFGLSGGSSAVVAARQEPGHTHPAAFQQLTSHINLPHTVQRVQKRRHEPDEDADLARPALRDVAMDRSPTPERPRRGVPKRVKLTLAADAKDESAAKENKHRGEEDDVDVGVLLASLPPQSLLPLLNAMISVQPSLKSLILPLIPRPTLETALQVLDQSAKKLREAYPYSNTPTFLPVSATSSLGFGFSSHQRSHQVTDGGQMRESYILSRLRPHIGDFVGACMSYVPYFSYISAGGTTAHGSGSSHSHSAALQLQHKDKSHPSETFMFLSALTSHILSQPSLTQYSLAPLLLPRLSQEWAAWADRIDGLVNRQGGMFGGETVRLWEKTLDEFADARGPEGWSVMKDIRDRWIAKVGWLVGRNVMHPMEEEV